MAKILIIDDSDFVRQSIKKSLAKEGHKDVVEARTKKEAIDKFKSEKPDLILLDIIMEESRTGMDILKEIKRLDKNAVSIIIVSVVEEDETLGEAMRVGVNGYVNKPIDYNKLVKEVKKVLK